MEHAAAVGNLGRRWSRMAAILIRGSILPAMVVAAGLALINCSSSSKENAQAQVAAVVDDLTGLSAPCQNACRNATGNERNTAVCYSCKCKQALGTLPTPAELKCSLGAEIKVYRATRAGDTGPYTETEVTNGDAVDCLNPALLSAVPANKACLPGSRLGQLTRGGVTFKWICRRKSFHAGYADPTTDKEYEDYGVIGYRPSTGATCWWDDKDAHNDGEDIPDLDLTDADPVKIDRFTAVLSNTEGDGCKNCHDNDPFMYTPYLKSVGWRTSDELTGSAYLQVRSASAPTPVDTLQLTSEAAGPCTSCHRISNGGTCTQLWAMDAMGEKITTRPYQTIVTTDTADSFPLPFWMSPPTRASFPRTRDLYHTRFDAAKEHIRTCCANATAPGCTWSAFPTPEAPAPVVTPEMPDTPPVVTPPVTPPSGEDTSDEPTDP